MAEKILNTRIQLKYDTWANWQAIQDSFFPKRGEICLVELPSTPEGQTIPTNPPTVLFKVGTWDGTDATKKSFAQLDWASAKAADVYSWAKASEVKLVGKKLTFVGGATNGGNVEVAFDYVTLSEVNGLLANYYTKAEINTTLANYSTTEQMNAAIDADVLVETNRAIAAENALANRVKDIEDNKADYATKTEAQRYANEAQSAAEQKATELVNAHTEAVNTKFNSYSTTEQMNAAIDADVLVETNRATGAEEALAGRIKTLEDTSHDFAGADAELKAELQAEIDADVKALADGAVKANTEAIAAINDTTKGILATAKAYTDTLANGAVAANTAAVAANTAAIAAINDVEDGILAIAKAYTDEVKDALLGTEELVGTYDTLKEIGAWIANSGVDATELSGAIAAEAKAREDADKLLATKAELAAETKAREDADTAINETIATLATQEALNAEIEAREDLAENVLANAQSLTDIYGSSTSISGVNVVANADRISALESASSDYATKEELGSLENRINEDKATTSDITALDERISLIENDYVTSEELSGDLSSLKSEITGESSKTISDLDAAIAAEASARESQDNAINKTLSEIVDTKDGILAQAKAYSDSLNHEDTKYTAATAGGLKLNTDNSFAIDDSLVFVFDCGSATKNV